MTTIRQLLSKLIDHIDYMDAEELESGVREASSIIDDITSLVDEVEQKNNVILAIAEDLKKSDIMRDLADVILEPSEIIGKITY